MSSLFKKVKKKTYAVFHDPAQIWLRSKIMKRGPDIPLVIVNDEALIVNLDVAKKFGLKIKIYKNKNERE